MGWLGLDDTDHIGGGFTTDALFEFSKFKLFDGFLLFIDVNLLCFLELS